MINKDTKTQDKDICCNCGSIRVHKTLKDIDNKESGICYICYADLLGGQDI